MVYSTGIHPHIRSSDSLAGRYWTASAFLFPSVIIKIVISWKQFFLLALLFCLTAAVRFSFGLMQPIRVKSASWRQGVLVLWIFLWFLMLPQKIFLPAAVLGFIFPLIFIYELFGGLGAYPIHPVLAGFLITHLFFPQESLSGILESGRFFILGCSNLILLALGGIYLGLRKKIRLIPAFVFIGSVLLSALILRVTVDLEVFYTALLLGFYVQTDTAVSPLKAGAHLISALGSGLCMTALMMLGKGVMLSGTMSLAVWNLTSQGFDFLGLPGKRLKAAVYE